MTNQLSLAAPFLSPRENENDSLHSPLLASDAGAEAIVHDDGELKTGASGQTVSRVQRALIAAGDALPKFGADGHFGAETTNAVEKFQREHDLAGTGVIDSATLGALDAAGGAQAARYPEYDRLYAGGVLHGTIAIGYDEDSNDVVQREQVVAGLKQRGFTSSDQVHWSVTQRDGAQLALTLIDRNSPQAKQQFAQAMASSPLVIYAGHARYGSGPDFDPIDSPSGNFVMGPSYAPGHVTFGSNDLAKTPMTPGYQLMFFDGCQTTDYLKDLRSIPKNKNAGNLDLVVSNAPISWGNASANVFIALDGVMQRKSVDELQSSYEQENGVGYTADGFANNRYRPG